MIWHSLVITWLLNCNPDGELSYACWCKQFVVSAYRTKNIHCVSRACGPTLIERGIYIVCAVRLWSHVFRVKNIHCVSRVCGPTLIEQRIYIVCTARLWSHVFRTKHVHCVGIGHVWPHAYIKNEEYTLCVACLWHHAFRMKNMHCV